jgi:hypothetical protein
MARRKKASVVTEAVRVPDGLTPCLAFKNKPITWLWDGVVSCPSLVLLAGRGGCGKSLIAADFASRITTGRNYDESRPPADPHSVIWLPAEDAVEQVVVPRLRAAGADMGRVFVAGVDESGTVTKRWSLPGDAEAIGQMASAVDARVIVLDPLASLCQGIDLNQQQAVRALCSELYAVALRHRLAWFCLAHPNKATTGAVLDRVFGSASLVHCARSVMLAGSHPHISGVKVFVHAKSNEGALQKTKTYSIHVHAGQATIEWGELANVDAEELGVESLGVGERDAAADARSLLRQMLEKQAVPAADVIRDAKDCGIGERTLRTAKAELRIPSRRETSAMGVVQWVWCPPAGGFKDGQL